MLIGLAGVARSGKDTCCAALGWHRAAFADALKSDLAGLLSNFPPGTSKEITRPIMVAYGAAWREVDGDHWLNRLYFPSRGNVCVCDVRYANEVEYLQRHGGTVFRLHRPGYAPANEEEVRSFAAIDAMHALPQVVNAGAPEDMARQVLGYLAAH